VFNISEDEVDRLLDIARKHKTLVLDLRENPGGTVLTLRRMVGNVMDHEVKIADRVGRTEMKLEWEKSRGKRCVHPQDHSADRQWFGVRIRTI